MHACAQGLGPTDGCLLGIIRLVGDPPLRKTFKREIFFWGQIRAPYSTQSIPDSAKLTPMVQLSPLGYHTRPSLVSIKVPNLGDF